LFGDRGGGARVGSDWILHFEIEMMFGQVDIEVETVSCNVGKLFSLWFPWCEYCVVYIPFMFRRTIVGPLPSLFTARDRILVKCCACHRRALGSGRADGS
jgi:hypothetical protein